MLLVYSLYAIMCKAKTCAVFAHTKTFICTVYRGEVAAKQPRCPLAYCPL